MVKLNLDIPKDFYKEEVRCDYKITSEMKKVWAVELDLINELDKICKKHNIKYIADSGTLLGAVRHKGFIPWDDDIDVVMLREDYEKLCNVAETEFTRPYFFQTNKTDVHYYRGHAQLRNCETTGALENEINVVPFNQGIFIDIFPLDTVPFAAKEFNRWIKEKNKAFNKLQIFYIAYNTSTKKRENGVKDILKILRQHLFKFLCSFSNEHKVFDKYMQVCEKYSNTDKNFEFVDKVAFRYSNKFVHIKKEWYADVLYVDFENIRIPIPANYNEILVAFYGEWKKPAKAPTAHGSVIFDVDKSYKKYLSIGV